MTALEQIAVYSRHRLRRRDLDPDYDERRLATFEHGAWVWTAWLIGVAVIGGVADFVGLVG